MTDQPIPDRGSGTVARERLEALGRRVGPSLDAIRQHPLVGWAVVLFVVLTIAALAVLGTIESVIHIRRELVLPDLTGKTLDQALDTISSMNLSLSKQGVEFNEAFPPGAIIKQEPAPGLKVREGKFIRVTLSSGGQVIFVPDLANKPLPEAQNQLRSSGLLLGALSEVHSQNREAGWVIEQNPAAGTVVNRGQMIDLRVSKGLPPEGTTLMPDFVNQPVSRANDWASDKKVRADVREELRPDMLPGLVITQVPAPDTPVNESSAVQFVVSRSTLTASNAQTIRYDVPAGTDRVMIRIVVRDERGEREIFQGYQDPGSLVEVPVVARGASRARIFVNGVLIEEKMLE